MRRRLVCNSLIGFNFGDGHLHNEDLIKAVQDAGSVRARRAGGGVGRVTGHRQQVQHYKVIDAALGVIERGTWKVTDAVNEQPWLPNGPIPLQVTWTRPAADARFGSGGVTTALVVGSGPNGLAAAVALAKEGVQVTVLEAADEIGGGARSSEAIVPGLLHDHCSAFHPMAVGSTFLNGLGLERYGLQWRWPEIDCAHPLDSGDAGVLRRSLDDTVAGLGSDGPRWRSIFGRPSADFDVLSEDIMGPLLRVPKHPLALARFGLPTVLPASTFARIFRTERARALFGGVAAHTFRPLHYPMTSAIGLGIITAGHRFGWPVAAGGSQSITNALGGDARRSRRQDRDRVCASKRRRSCRRPM